MIHYVLISAFKKDLYSQLSCALTSLFSYPVSSILQFLFLSPSVCSGYNSEECSVLTSGGAIVLKSKIVIRILPWEWPPYGFVVVGNQ